MPECVVVVVQDEVIQKAHVVAPEGNGFTVTAGLTEQAAVDLTKEVEMVSSTASPKPCCALALPHLCMHPSPQCWQSRVQMCDRCEAA